jgi:hypothetical protein
LEKGNFHSRIWSLVSGQKNAERGLVPNIARRGARVIPEPKKISHRAGPVIAEPVSCAIISCRTATVASCTKAGSRKLQIVRSTAMERNALSPISWPPVGPEHEWDIFVKREENVRFVPVHQGEANITRILAFRPDPLLECGKRHGALSDFAALDQNPAYRGIAMPIAPRIDEPQMPTICEADFSRALDLNEEHLNTVSQPNEGQGDAVIGLGLDRPHARKDGVEIIRSAKKRRGELAGAGQRTVDNGLVVTRQEAVFRRLGLTRDNLLRLHS